MSGEIKEPKLPSISLTDISPLGLVTIKFNQDFVVPLGWQ